MKWRVTKEQIIGFLREADGGLPVAKLYRRHSLGETPVLFWLHGSLANVVSDVVYHSNTTDNIEISCVKGT